MTNLTLAIDEELLRKARKLAVERDTSVNQLVRDYLGSLVSQQDRRRLARERLLGRMRERPVVVGPRTWTRDDLHER